MQTFCNMNIGSNSGKTGAVECAKVLLRNGAKASHRGGWDGGYHLPQLRENGDYWYTSRNSPLHQAARGNHPGIIHLILNGRVYHHDTSILLVSWSHSMALRYGGCILVVLLSQFSGVYCYTICS